MSPLDNITVQETVTPIASTNTGDAPIFVQCEGIPKHLVGPVDFNHPCAAHVQIDPITGIRKIEDASKRRSKVCIVGYAENSRHLAWYDDPDCEIWGVNQVYRFIPRMDRNFQIHENWDDASKWAAGTDQKKWITESPIPTYMVRHFPDMPNSINYPVEWVKQQLNLAGDPDLPGTGLDYFTSSIAFMYALAIAEGFESIGIYGIDLIIGREYFFEKACVEFYMGIAHARGIHIHKPDNCALLWQSHRYGYEVAPNYGFFGLDKLQKRAADLKRQVQIIRDEVKMIEGQRAEAEFVVDRLGEPAKSQYAERQKEISLLLDKKLNELYAHDGAYQEVMRMYELLELKSRGACIGS